MHLTSTTKTCTRVGTDFKFAGPLAHGVLDHKVSFLLFNQSPLPPPAGKLAPKVDYSERGGGPFDALFALPVSGHFFD